MIILNVDILSKLFVPLIVKFICHYIAFGVNALNITLDLKWYLKTKL